MRRRLISMLLLVVTLFSLASCERDREYDEAEVLAAAAELVELSRDLNEIYYGKGLGYDEEDGIGAYKRATSSSLMKYGITTVDDLRAKTKAVFSQQMSASLFNMALDPIYNGTSIVGYRRYYQEYDDDGNSTSIMVKSNYEYFGTGEIIYREGITVWDVEGDVIIVNVPVTLVRESDGKTKDTVLKVRLIEEEGGWRLHSDSYAVYNESSDKYDELNKK